MNLSHARRQGPPSLKTQNTSIERCLNVHTLRDFVGVETGADLHGLPLFLVPFSTAAVGDDVEGEPEGEEEEEVDVPLEGDIGEVAEKKEVRLIGDPEEEGEEESEEEWEVRTGSRVSSISKVDCLFAAGGSMSSSSLTKSNTRMGSVTVIKSQRKNEVSMIFCIHFSNHCILRTSL